MNKFNFNFWIKDGHAGPDEAVLKQLDQSWKDAAVEPSSAVGTIYGHYTAATMTQGYMPNSLFTLDGVKQPTYYLEIAPGSGIVMYTPMPSRFRRVLASFFLGYRYSPI
jgi:hypothetical protein